VHYEALTDAKPIRLQQKKKFKRGEFDFPSPWWDDVSAEAKDLVNNLLVVNPADRFTIDQCLAHPWIQNDGVSAHRLHRCAVK
jgi:serine/threonine protein kinase